MTISTSNRTGVLAVLALLTSIVQALALAGALAYADIGEEAVAVTVVTEHTDPSEAGPPRGPELARDQASLEVLWDGFTRSSGGGRSEPPPLPAPSVDFDRFVTVAVVSGGVEPTVLRTADALIFDISSPPTEPDGVTLDLGSGTLWLLAVDRSDVPASPFRLIERSGGVVYAESVVSVTLPHTGVPVSGALPEAVMLLATGTMMVRVASRRRTV